MKKLMMIVMVFVSNVINAHDFITRSDRQLILSRYHDDLYKLPIQPLLHGMLEQRYPYEFMMTDDDGQYSYVLIKSCAPYTYLAGNPSTKQLQDIVQKLSDYCKTQDHIFDVMHNEKIALICDPALHAFFIEQGLVIKPRIQFAFAERKNVQLKALPVGYKVIKIDTIECFNQSIWADFIAKSCGSVDIFLERSFGYAVLNEQGFAVAQSYGAWVGNNQCEVGLVTHPDYRGQGYVMHAVGQVIAECLQRNVAPVWSCNYDNIASYKIALKLGFVVKNYYVFLKMF